MGRGAVTHLRDLLDHTTTVNRRDTFCHNLWGQGCYPSRGKLPNAEDELLHFKQQWWTTGEEPRFDRGKKRKTSDPIGLLPLKAQAGVWRQCEVQAISTRGLSVKESCRCYQKPILGKAGTQLGRAIPNYFNSRNRCILLRGLRWKSYTSSLECK